MRIQHNIMAMNAYRNYNTNTSALSKNLEKLSSGYKINRAGDDAAGLAISEKMRAQITGLNAAQKNVKDGISLVKTAEGAMQEIQDMLNRMDYLATQSANGTYQDDVDREALQKEVNQLRDEINRIADSANFNGIKLLDGSLDNTTEIKVTTGEASTLVAAGATTAATTQGTNTILHKDAVDAKKLTFDWDLSNATVALDTGKTTGKFSATIGDLANIDVTVTETMDSEALAKGIYDALKAKVASGKDIAVDGVTLDTTNNVNFTVELDGDVLHFAMSDKSLESTTAASAFVKAPTIANPDLTDVVLSGKSDTDFKASNVSIGAPKGGAVLADTVSEAWTVNDFTDKLGLKIGDTTYVLALTEDTLNTNYGEGYKTVDLTDLVDKTTGKIDKSKLPGTGTPTDDHVIQAALGRISEAAEGNEMWSVQVNATAKTLNFRENKNYSGDADLTTLDGVKAQLQKYASVTAKENNVGGGTALQLQIGDTSDSYNQLKVSVGDMHCKALGIDGLSIGTAADASAAIQTIKDAINQVSSVRGDLGAYQNRLEHTQNNLSVMAENIQDAESTIRDTDVAEEMMSYVKNNILVQSAQAMLAQANQVPQGVLQLLG